MSCSRTGPLTLRMMERVVSSRKTTRTWVTPPRDPEGQSFSIHSLAVFMRALIPPAIPPIRICNPMILPTLPFYLVGSGGWSVPVRPRTLETLTSLTAALVDSMLNYGRPARNTQISARKNFILISQVILTRT